MEFKYKNDKEKITSDEFFVEIDIKNISNKVPIGEEYDRFFKFSTLLDDEKFIFIIRKLDYLQEQVDILRARNDLLEFKLREMNNENKIMSDKSYFL